MKLETKLVITKIPAYDEQVEILENLCHWAGPSWLQNILREIQLKNRTKYVDAFRTPTGVKLARNPSGKLIWKAIQVPGRTKTDRLKTCEELLRANPLEFWFYKYFEDRALVDFINLLEHLSHRAMSEIECKLIMRVAHA
jgi:hypothetical protein